jgi:hypothetical protein
MSNREQGAGNGIGLQGFINLRLEKKDGTIIKEQHNTITLGGKKWLLANSAQKAMAVNTAIKGRLVTFDNIVMSQQYSNVTKDVYFKHNVLTNVLLNLGISAQESLTQTSTFLPIIKSNGEVDSTKIIGKANNRISSTGSTIEGQIEDAKSTYMADDSVVTNQWEYPAGVATGTIDTIAMVAGNSIINTPTGGLRVAKCIDGVNFDPTQSSVKSVGFLPPGVGNFTGNSEILLNYSQDGISQHKYNMATGETTDSPTAFAVLPYNTMDYYIEDGYLYALVARDATADVTTYDDTVYVYVYDVATMTEQTHFSLGSRDYSKSAFIKESGQLYVCAVAGSGYNNVLISLTKSGSYYDGTGTQSTFQVPAGFDPTTTIVGMCGSNYVLYTAQRSCYNVDNAYNDTYTAFIFTSLSDPMGTLIDIIPELFTTSCLWHANNNYGVIDINYSAYRDRPYTSSIDDSFTYYTNDVNNRCQEVVTNDATPQVVNLDTLHGVYITNQGMYSTIMSFVKLQEPITKASEDILHVTYGYRIV